MAPSQKQAVERLVNLSFALQGAANSGRGTRSAEWIRRNVDGYQAVSYTHLTLPTTPYV